MSKPKISPSILAADCSTHESLAKAVEVAEKGGADYLHVDVMDGNFVANKTVWNKPENISSIKTSLPLDVHIMIRDPDVRYLEFVHAGVTRLAFHIEASDHPEALIGRLHSWGVSAGLAISPQTPLDRIIPFLELVDYCLVMSVDPGKSGQKFVPETLERIDFLKEHSPGLEIQVDGGIDLEIAKDLIRRGVSVLVVGSGIYSSSDPLARLKSFKNIL